MPTQPADMPPVGPSDARRNAADAAQRGDPAMSIAWSLVAVTAQLDGLRRDLQQAKRGR